MARRSQRTLGVWRTVAAPGGRQPDTFAGAPRAARPIDGLVSALGATTQFSSRSAARGSRADGCPDYPAARPCAPPPPARLGLAPYMLKVVYATNGRV